MTNPTPATTPPVTLDPNQQLLTEAVRQIGRLCELLAGGTPAARPAAPQVAAPAPAAPVPAAAPNDPTGVGGAVSLGAFMATVADLTPDEQGQVIDAALAMLEQVYVHLPLKRAMHAIDPIQRLRLLRQRYADLSPRGFHDEMIAVFHSLRDLHTNYLLPQSYQGKTAFLPFQVEEYFDGTLPTRRYAVTRVQRGFSHPTFGPGVEVTHWNGVPIARAVEVNADREAGSNQDARLARGLDSLTIRWMGQTAPPDEEWVIVAYMAGGQPQELRVPWQVFQPPAAPTGGGQVAAADPATAHVLGVDARTEAIRRARKALFDPTAVDREVVMAAAAARAGVLEPAAVPTGPAASFGPVAAQMGVGPRGGFEAMDFQTEGIRRARKALFYPESVELEKRMAEAVETTTRPAGGLEGLGAPVPSGPANESLMPDVFTFKTVTGQLGYIRIATFMVNDANAFVAEFVRIARSLPQNGLIVDVRGNGGGNILAGERLLQVLTPLTIEPARLHFINTPTTLKLVQNAPPSFGLDRWVPSIQLAAQTGEIYSQGWPLDAAEDYNRIGQQYQGPVVLIIDALCYSTTDIFSAGFQDHQIGKVLGVHQHTGAGGANVWDLGLLNSLLPDDFKPLPKGASFRVAIRRTTRVKDQAGVPLEDLGVVPPPPVHRMTRNDILNGNPDLIAAAAKLFDGVPVRSLKGAIVTGQPAVIQVQAANVSRVDAYAPNGQPVGTAGVQNGTATLTLNPRPGGTGRLRLCGFDKDELVVVGWIDL